MECFFRQKFQGVHRMSNFIDVLRKYQRVEKLGQIFFVLGYFQKVFVSKSWPPQRLGIEIKKGQVGGIFSALGKKAGTPLGRLMLSALGSQPSQRDNIGIYKMTIRYVRFYLLKVTELDYLK